MKSRTHAFTLVELLVVIGIIALLISILLPSLNRARQSGMTTVSLSNLRQISSALFMYINDHDSAIPPKTVPASPESGITGPGAFYTTQYGWVGKRGTVLHYPNIGADVRYLNTYIGDYRFDDPVDIAHAPADSFSYKEAGTSYYNNMRLAADRTLLSDRRVGGYQLGVKITQVKSPSKMVAIAEGGAYYPGWIQLSRNAPGGYLWNGEEQKFNLGFVDGHAALHLVETLKPGEPRRELSQDYTFYIDRE